MTSDILSIMVGANCIFGDIRKCLAIGAMLFSLPLVVLPQSQSLRISGAVRDESGLGIAGAKITLTNESTSATQAVTAQPDGKYSFASVSPGRYALAAEAPGFKRGERQHVVVKDSKQLVTEDFILPVVDQRQIVRVGSPQELLTEGKSSSASVRYSDETQMKPSEVNTAIDYGGHSSAGPAATNSLIQGMTALANPTASTGGESEASLFEQGDQLLLAQRFDQAIDAFAGAVKRHPQSVNLQIGLGVALYARARFDDAVKAFCAASDLSPSDPRPYFFLARLGDNAAGSPEVTKRLERYISLRPESAPARYYYAMNLWQSQRRQGRVNAGQLESMLKKSIALDAKMADAFLALGNLYFDAQRYPEAIQQYQQAISLQPDLPEAHYRLGQAYSRTGETEPARRELELHERLRQNQPDESARWRAEMQRLIDSAKQTPAPK